MTSSDIKRYALILAEQAEIEGMKAENTMREQNNSSLAYTGSQFSDKADNLRNLAYTPDDEL